MMPVNLKLEEIQKGTEFLFKSLMKTKYDMEMTENYLKSGPSSEKR